MTEDELLAVLLQEFPEHKIKTFSKNRYYRDIRALALEKELTVNQYLKQLGFKLSKGNLEETILALMEAFPDGKVNGLLTKHIKLGKKLKQVTEKANKTLGELLADYGMELVGKNGDSSIEEIIAELKRDFPNGKAFSLKQTHSKQCYVLERAARIKGITLKEFLAEYGIEVIRKNSDLKTGDLSIKEIIAELKRDFPNGKAFSLKQTHRKHLYVLERAARAKGMTVKGFLAEHDIEVVRLIKGKEGIQAIPVEEAVLEKEKYLNKTKYDEELMRELIEDYKFTTSDFVTYLGVTRQAIDLKMKRINGSFFSWDVKELPKEHFVFFKKMLKEELAFNQSDTHYNQILFSQKKKKFAITVFPKDLTDFPLCWRDDSLPEELIDELFKKDYHIFNNHDFLRLQDIRNSNVEEYVSSAGNLYRVFRTLAQKHYDYCVESGVLKEFYADEETHSTRFEQFAKLKGLKYETKDKRLISEEEIITVLESFKNPLTNIVKIPIEDAQYQRMVNLAKNRGHSLKTFIESFGYNYKRLRMFDEEFKRKSHQKKLEQLENYKVTDDAVYILPYSTFYTNLTAEGRNKGYKGLTEYLLQEFGLKRLYRNELPEGYIPYELGDSEEDLVKEEKFLKHIENHLMLSDEESYFYIDSGTNFYLSILKYTTLIGISVDDFFEKWGLKRLNYSNALNYLINEIEFSKEEAEMFLNRTKHAKYNDVDVNNEEEKEHSFDEKDREHNNNSDTVSDDEKGILEENDDDDLGNTQEKKEDSNVTELDENELLSFLKNISNQVVDVVSVKEKKKRSQLLVRKMKELYDYKCQLCDPDNPIPVIEMDNGKAYVEMHHIIALSSSNAEDETDLILDNYANCVVVCSHHHKVLHYHRGGFTELDELIDGLYFVNDETEVKIHLNKHLSI